MRVSLEVAIERAKESPPEAQDELARLIFEFADTENIEIDLTEDEARSFDESIGQADRGEFASEEDMRAIWAKYGL